MLILHKKIIKMKKLELSELHEALGAKMVNFSGYYMPINYMKGIKEEHRIVREQVGLFDVSHMGEVFVNGRDSLEFLQYVTSNDVSKLLPGRIQYSYLPNETGGIVDDFLLYMIAENSYLLVLNASNLKKDLMWLRSKNTFECKIIDKSSEFSLLALQGPKSINLLQKLTDINLDSIKYYNFIISNVCDIKDVIISRTGYTGELGFELYVKNDNVRKLWNYLFSTSEELHPIGLGARNTLRLEKGFCLYGNDIDENTSPISAGLSWITSFNKRFINSENLLKEKDEGTRDKLVGIELLEKGIARKDYKVLDLDGNEVGRVTSGTMSPTLNKSISMAYVRCTSSSLGNKLHIKVRNKNILCEIVNLPFVK